MMPPPLLSALDAEGHIHLVIGTNPLSSARCTKSLEVGARPIVVAPSNTPVHYVLEKKIADGQVKWIQEAINDTHLTTLGRDDVDNYVDAVFITSNTHAPEASRVSRLCRRLRIPVNVVDAPSLCTFTLLSTHSDGPLQIGITTSGKGCKLASRIRREIASSLPPKFGDAVERLGIIRRRLIEEDHRAHDLPESTADMDDDDAPNQRPTFNRLISDDDIEAARTRRMRWLSQICEYWPLKRLAAITDADIETIMRSYSTKATGVTSPPLLDSDIDHRRQSTPVIYLAGAGPGSPLLLTLATHRAIQTATVVLADKLVPSPVLDLIPRRSRVHIARKFPGNADAAQDELLQLGHDALQQGHTVLRLKQGDPYLYGRGAEEFAFFSAKGYAPVVLPGIASALAAPLFANIPPTHRSVADQVLICTGTGRKGAAPEPPDYLPSQTVVFLMSLHRLGSLVDSLVTQHVASDEKFKAWPLEVPCAVIERATCPDQRVIRSTLQHVCAAVEEEGSRPPGLLVVGWSCHVLFPEMAGRGKWVVEEGLRGFDDLELEDGWVKGVVDGTIDGK